MKTTVDDVLQLIHYYKDVRTKMRHDETMLLYNSGSFVYNT